MENGQPVLLSAKVKKDLASSGARLEIICVEDAKKTPSGFTGKWAFHIVKEGETGEICRSQVVVHGTLAPKVIKTMTGLISLATELQLTAPVIPLVTGEKGVWYVDENEEGSSQE